MFDDASEIIFVQGIAHLGAYIGLPGWLIAVLANGIGLGINTVLSFIPQIGCLFFILMLSRRLRLYGKELHL